MARVWGYTVDIYEQTVGPKYPVVQHVFWGKTKAEAKGYYEAHLETDSFFKACIADGKFGDIECHANAYWVQMKLKKPRGGRGVGL
jgi:hypothetical protein